jgi:hypothetical protein
MRFLGNQFWMGDSSWNLGPVGSNHSNELACHRPDRRNRIMDAGSKGSEISID